MATLNNFNANEVDPNFEFEAIPQGKYLAALVASEMKKTKNGKGQFLKLEFQVLDGPCKGRKVFDQLVLNHPSADAVRIARAKLSAVCRAVGVMTPKDSIELHNIPLMIDVGHKRREDNGELANKIKGYEKKGAAVAKPAAAAAGLRQSESMYSLRITGPDYPGLLAELTRALGHAGINIHGASAASIEGHCVIYLRFECEADVPRAEQVLRSQLGPDTCPPALPPV